MSKVTASFDLNIKEAKASLKELEKGYKELSIAEKENKDLIDQFAKKREELTKQIIRQQEAQKKYKKEIRDNVKAETELYLAQNRQIKSIKDLREVTNALVRQRDRLDHSTAKGKKEFDKLTKQININTKALKKYDTQIGRSQRNVGNYAGVLGKATAKLFAFTGGIYALIQASKQLIIEASEISDIFSDIEKTTGLTATQIRRLDKDLQDFDTRSSRKELLEMSVVAGRMDIAGQDIADFVEVVDKAIVSLKGELDGSAEDIATDLAKMSSVYGFEERFGVAEGINKIGSAINYLGANTKAQAQPMLEFAKRMQGISKIAKIGIGDIIGLGAGFDALGGNVEVNATSINQLLVAMGNKTEEFARLAGVSFEEFNDILKKDANEALILFANNTGDTAENIVDLTKKLDGLGLKGKKVVETIGLLSGNTETFRKHQKLANEEIARGTSLTKEFDIKNKNLAANLEKIWKNITTFFVSSALIDTLTKITSLFVSTQTELEKVTAKSSRSRDEFELLASSFENLTKKTELTKEETAYLEKSYKNLQTLYPSYLENLTLEKDNYTAIQRALKIINKDLEDKAKLSAKQAIEADTQNKLAESFKKGVAIIEKRQRAIKKLADLEKKKDKEFNSSLEVQSSKYYALTQNIETQTKLLDVYKYKLKQNKKEEIEYLKVAKEKADAIEEFFNPQDTKLSMRIDFENETLGDAIENDEPIEIPAKIKFVEDDIDDKFGYSGSIELFDMDNIREAEQAFPEMIDGITELNEATKGQLELQDSIADIGVGGLKTFFSEGLKGANALEKGFNAVKDSVINLASTLLSKAAIFGLLNLLSGNSFGFGMSLLKLFKFAKGGQIPEKFASGGLSPNSRNIIINDDNSSKFREYIINGEKTAKYKPILDTINFGSDSQINNMLSGGSAIPTAEKPASGGVTHLATGGIIPRNTSNNNDIMTALSNINRSIAESANMNNKGQRALLNKDTISLKEVSNTGIYKASVIGGKQTNTLTETR